MKARCRVVCLVLGAFALGGLAVGCDDDEEQPGTVSDAGVPSEDDGGVDDAG